MDRNILSLINVTASEDTLFILCRNSMLFPSVLHVDTWMKKHQIV